MTDDDYEQVLVPAIEHQRDTQGKIRFVYVLGERFDGWTLGALWDDAKLGMKDIRTWERIALVTDKEWLHHTVKALGWMVPGDVRVFGVAEFGWVAGATGAWTSLAALGAIAWMLIRLPLAKARV